MATFMGLFRSVSDNPLVRVTTIYSRYVCVCVCGGGRRSWRYTDRSAFPRIR